MVTQNEGVQEEDGFADWEEKTLIRDLERVGKPLDDIYLADLTALNEKFYGNGRLAKFKKRRAYVSHKLIDYKRKTPAAYLKFVKSFGITPNPSTEERAKTSGPKKKRTTNNKKEDTTKTEPATEPEPETKLEPETETMPENETKPKMEEIDSQLKNIRLDDKKRSAAPTPLTPPRKMSTHMKSPNMTPPRSVQLPSTAISTVSNITDGQALTTYRKGSYENPWIFDVQEGFSGRYLNDIWVYEESKQVKDYTASGGKKYSYQGYLFKRKVDPPDAYLYSAVVCAPDYLDYLVSVGVLDDEDLEHEFVLFRGPYVEANDRVGKGGYIKHMWPAPECQEVVKTVHTNIKIPNEDDDSPGPSWFYTAAKFPKGYLFDNRIFSDHDLTITPFESTPNKAKSEILGNEEVLAFHVMWRVAIKGSETLMDLDTKMTLAERMKKRREEAGRR